jgi:hypothetical protein
MAGHIGLSHGTTLEPILSGRTGPLKTKYVFIVNENKKQKFCVARDQCYVQCVLSRHVARFRWYGTRENQ